MQVALLLALNRLVQLVLTSILALSRLDACLFTVLRGQDRGYASFLAMALMLHSFSDCLKQRKRAAAAAAGSGKPLCSPGAFSPGPLSRAASSASSAAAADAASRWQSAAASRSSSTAAPAARGAALPSVRELETRAPRSPAGSAAAEPAAGSAAAARWRRAVHSVTSAPQAASDAGS